MNKGVGINVFVAVGPPPVELWKELEGRTHARRIKEASAGRGGGGGCLVFLS